MQLLLLSSSALRADSGREATEDTSVFQQLPNVPQFNLMDLRPVPNGIRDLRPLDIEIK
jgi:hypothetical protein